MADSDLASRLRAKANSSLTQPFQVVSGSSIEKTAMRIQVEGDAGTGKSDFLLSIVEHYVDTLNYPPEQVLLCIIDFDAGGVGELLEAGRLPDDLQHCVWYANVKNVWEAYSAFGTFKKMLSEHRTKYGVMGWLGIENMGALWDSSQSCYCEEIYGMPLYQLKLEKMKEAKSDTKKGKPTFDRMLEYGVINSIHDGLINEVSFGDSFHMVWTTHMKLKYDEKGAAVGQIGAGKKGIDAKVRFRLRKLIHDGEFIGIVVKSRGTKEHGYAIKNPTFTNFVERVGRQFRDEGKKNVMEEWETPL